MTRTESVSRAEELKSTFPPGPRKGIPKPVSAVPAKQRRKKLSRGDSILLGLAGVLTLIVLLELIPRIGIVDPRYLPPFSEMAAGLADWTRSGEFWVALGQTLTTWAIGLAIALIAGILLGILIGSVPLLQKATASTIEFLRPIPSVALIPLAVLLFGIGMEATLLLVIYASFWQVLVQVLYGVQDVDPVARDTARSYRFGFFKEGYRLVWPTVLPYAMTGFRLSAAVALILTLTGELIIGTPGLGKLLAIAQQSAAVASMYALVIVTGLLGVVINILARVVERRVLHWHPAIRRESMA